MVPHTLKSQKHPETVYATRTHWKTRLFGAENTPSDDMTLRSSSSSSSSSSLAFSSSDVVRKPNNLETQLKEPRLDPREGEETRRWSRVFDRSVCWEDVFVC